MTSRPPAAGEWLTVDQADVDAYLERARIHPGGITAGRKARDFMAGRKESDLAAYEPYAKKRAVDVPGLVEATVLRDEHGWTDADIGAVLGLHFSTVSRRRVSGFRSDHIETMRQAIDEVRRGPGHPDSDIEDASQAEVVTECRLGVPLGEPRP
jgi:hypothetical protein